MQFRHEWKHRIDRADLVTLRMRLSALFPRDPHGENGVYTVRSLYFDDLRDTALQEKRNGISRRDKFRIRLYGTDVSFIRLEKKSKQGGLCRKQSARLTAEDVRRILAGENGFLCESEEELLREFGRKLRTGLRPKTLVEYTREAFVFAPGNVRITLDYDIRTGLRATSLLSSDTVTVPVADDPILVEVKWDEFLPDCVRSAVTLEGRHASAFSKYAVCRMYE